MKLSKKVFYLITLTAVFSSLTSCSKKNENHSDTQTEEAITLEVKTADKSKPRRRSKWNNNNGIIAVLLGYGYNNETFLTETYQKVIDIYGRDEEGGLLYTMIYPEEFMHGSTARISDLYTKLEDKKVRGILLLGAPENINRPLAKLQDEWEDKIPYPIFSFFPQEEILAMEATSDFILEYEHSGDENLVEEETQVLNEKSLPKILINTIRYMTELPGPLPKDEELAAHVQQIVGKDKKLRRYIDGETGIPSINHFVIERPEAKK